MKNTLRLLLLLPVLLLAACATPQNNYDPLESVNRPIYRFNDTVDRYALKPVATGYRNYTPKPVQTGVGNFSQTRRLASSCAIVNARRPSRPVSAHYPASC